MPNEPGPERCPIRRAIPGSIEQREFVYTRHGTVDILTFLEVHTRRMEAAIPEANEAGHLIPVLEAFRREHDRLPGDFLALDGGGSQIADETTHDFAGCGGRWRPRLTPTHASWLHQGEIHNHAFGLPRLKRGSWTGREEYIAHVMASWPEYNRLYAHPFEWTWTNQWLACSYAGAGPFVQAGAGERCAAGSRSTPPEFLALLMSGDTYGGAPCEGDRHAFRAGTPLDEADRAGTGASAEEGTQSIGAIAGPMVGPMGMLGHPPR
jgi:hypothetical protein